MDAMEYYVDLHVAYAVLREVDAETHTAVLSLNTAPRCSCASCVMLKEIVVIWTIRNITLNILCLPFCVKSMLKYTDCIIVQHRTTMLCASCVMFKEIVVITYMDDTEYYTEHLVFAVLREVDAETHTAVLSFNTAPRCCARAVLCSRK